MYGAPWQCRIYGLDLPSSSAITGMHGAKAGVSLYQILFYIFYSTKVCRKNTFPDFLVFLFFLKKRGTPGITLKTQEIYYRAKHSSIISALKKGLLWRVVRFELPTDRKPMPTTPSVKALVRRATSYCTSTSLLKKVKRLTNRLPNNQYALQHPKISSKNTSFVNKSTGTYSFRIRLQKFRIYLAKTV